MAMSDSKAPLRTVKRVQFGILSPDEIVSTQLEFHNVRKSKKSVFVYTQKINIME